MYDNIIPLNTRRPLRDQFQMAANALDDFVVEDYAHAGIVERERLLIDLSQNMVAQIADDRFHDLFKSTILSNLTSGFNALYFMRDYPPTADTLTETLSQIKLGIVEDLSTDAQELRLTL